MKLFNEYSLLKLVITPYIPVMLILISKGVIELIALGVLHILVVLLFLSLQEMGSWRYGRNESNVSWFIYIVFFLVPVLALSYTVMVMPLMD